MNVHLFQISCPASSLQQGTLVYQHYVFNFLLQISKWWWLQPTFWEAEGIQQL